jgi:hypothetical protein
MAVSRATRPLRRVGFGPRFVLARAAIERNSGAPVTHAGTLRWLARVLGCRPAQLRRCLLGRVVSARAARRILAAAAA